jgi:hypothetical protein
MEDGLLWGFRYQRKINRGTRWKMVNACVPCFHRRTFIPQSIEHFNTRFVKKETRLASLQNINNFIFTHASKKKKNLALQWVSSRKSLKIHKSSLTYQGAFKSAKKKKAKTRRLRSVSQEYSCTRRKLRPKTWLFQADLTLPVSMLNATCMRHIHLLGYMRWCSSPCYVAGEMLVILTYRGQNSLTARCCNAEGTALSTVKFRLRSVDMVIFCP